VEPLIGIGLALVVALFFVVFMSIRDSRNKERISTVIRRAGGEPIEVSFKFVGYDRDNQHYEVHFADTLGRKHQTRCKVNIWQNHLFWQQTPAELLSDLPAEEERWRHLAAEPANAKEQIIDDLAAENERLREQLRQAELLDAELKRAR
jgi:hypothetical protein